jgi:ribonucleoside-diphosphate reductase alpha chain
MKRARYSALRERSVGLGVMGFHSFLQAQGIPFESALAKSWNFKIFRKIRRDAGRCFGCAAHRARALPGLLSSAA